MGLAPTGAGLEGQSSRNPTASLDRSFVGAWLGGALPPRKGDGPQARAAIRPFWAESICDPRRGLKGAAAEEGMLVIVEP